MLPQITILDGGMGGELIRRGHATRTELWSALALLEAPDDVLAVHADYIAAGARLIITNTYSTIAGYLGKAGLQLLTRVLNAGATLIGGCCGIGPEYISALARADL